MECPQCGTVDMAPPVFASYVLQVFMNCYFIFNKSSQKIKSGLREFLQRTMVLIWY